jgi:catechol 2,3-dioxygenase
VKRVVEAGHPIGGASDHTSHLAVYISDPDGNGIELAWDRSPEFWRFMLEGRPKLEDLAKATKRLDVGALIAEAQ